MVWKDIEQVRINHRYELVLSGEKLLNYFRENNEIDENLWSLEQLNFLELSNCSLIEVLSENIGNLKHLTTLILNGNRLKSLANNLKSLENLRHLNLSNNCLEEINEDLFFNLNQLETINLSQNQLKSFPTLSLINQKKLIFINLSSNNLQTFDHLTNQLENLSQIDLSFNQLKQFPTTFLQLNSLKILHLESNQIQEIPSEISQLPKLKEIHLQSNPIKDNRLKKLIEQNKIKQIIDYLQRHFNDQQQQQQRSFPSTNEKSSIHSSSITSNKSIDLIRILHFDYPNMKSIQITSMNFIRPYLLCCIIRDLDFQTEGNLKKFLQLQNELHDDICQKRTLATIGTHDLSLLTSNLIYGERNSKEIHLIPLGKSTREISAYEFFHQLFRDAENERKMKKRNQLSGLHKYLTLINDKDNFSYLSDENQTILSLPPLTNADRSKLTLSTESIFVEISSTQSIEICRRIMNLLIRRILQLKLSKNHFEKDSQDEQKNIQQILTLQQTRLVDDKGKLKLIYPSRTDFDDQDFNEHSSIRIERLFPSDH